MKKRAGVWQKVGHSDRLGARRVSVELQQNKGCIELMRTFITEKPEIVE